MEFQINTDLSTLPKVIDFNFEALKDELDIKLDYYRSLVVTEDGIKAAKSDRAALNTLKRAVDDRRKEIKKQCLAPYEAFESKCKALTNMIDQASGSIDAQVKAFEEQEKSRKRAKIEASYCEQIGELSELLPFELFFNPKWMNKTSSLQAVIDELTALVESSKKDIQAIRNMHLDHEAAVLSIYGKTRDLSAAMAENFRLQRLAQEAARNLPPAPVMRDGYGALTEEHQEAKAMDAASCEQKDFLEERKTVKVVFYETTAAFRAEMKALTEKHNIRYGGIK